MLSQGKSSQDTLGVIGAGTMGSGIALAALLADLRVVLYDLEPSMLEKAREYIRQHLERKQRGISFKYLKTTTSFESISGCGYIIEAAPESLPLKQELFTHLDGICAPDAILATNTSTLPVTAIASAAERPERVAGMHFFNPAPVMPLVEVVQGARTASSTVEALVELANKMGKTPIVAKDTPGFIVNRVARPFYGEALRMLGEGTAAHEQIDLVVRQGAGFRMGPFELMDLIGIDVNFAATQSMYEQTFGEPRYRPHLIQARMVQQKALGRKTGRGFYRYDLDAPTPVPSGDTPGAAPEMTSPGLAPDLVVTPGSWAPGLDAQCREAGFIIHKEFSPGVQPAAAIIAAGMKEGLREYAIQLDKTLPHDVPLLCQTAGATLSEVAAWVEHPERLVGFDGLFFASGSAATFVAGPKLAPRARETVHALAVALEKTPVWIEDSPALILPRLICMLANEAAFAAGEAVAAPGVIDRAMQLGVNYPKGPLAWAEAIGYGRVAEVLEHLRSEYGEDRYRTAPLLRRLARQT